MVLEIQNLHLPKMHIWKKIVIIEKIVLMKERKEFEVVWSKSISKDWCHFPLVFFPAWVKNKYKLFEKTVAESTNVAHTP